MENGQILEDSLKKSKFDINDLLQEARNNGYFDISQIEYAIEEANGKISFLPKSKYAPITINDMKIKKEKSSVCTNLVMDSKIMYEHLKFIKKDEKWLMTRLKKEGYSNLDNILLLICDNKEKLTIFEKNIEKQEIKPFE